MNIKRDTVIYIFASVMVSLFIMYLSHLPVRVITPQIARLRYFSCQNGISGGPLSSSLSDWDWRKAFIWKASDTEYRQRQFSQFFETLTPRLYAHLYYWFGPFMWFPLNLLMVFAIAILIFVIVRQWTAGSPAAWVAASFWLMTPEVLVGHHAPMRYAKDFAAIEILGILSLFLMLRRKRRVWPIVIAVSFIWALGLFTDEYILFLFPSFAVALISWPWLKKVRLPLLISFLLLAAAGICLFLFVLPEVISPETKKPLARMSIDSWDNLGKLFFRNARYLILNTWDNISYTLGWTKPRYTAQFPPAALVGVILVFTAIIVRAWRGWGKMIVFWAIATGAVGGILLPEGNDILHQITYYNRPLIALLMIILGLFTANVFEYRQSWPIYLWLTALVIAALASFFAISGSIKNDPEEAYLTRYGLDDIIQLHHRIRSGSLRQPVYVAYPRFTDPINAVYDELEWITTYTLEDGFPWSLYRAIMPRLYLRHFEEGEVRADPKQFAGWKDVNEHEYRFECKTLYDMPAGTVWDLESIRSAIQTPPSKLVAREKNGREQKFRVVEDLFGAAPFNSLDSGDWSVSVPVPPEIQDPLLIFALRHDRPVSFRVVGGLTPGKKECSYRWSWQLFTAGLQPEISSADLLIRSEGELQLIGPLIISASRLAPLPPSLRKKIPPAGIPLLERHGESPGL